MCSASARAQIVRPWSRWPDNQIRYTEWHFWMGRHARRRRKKSDFDAVFLSKNAFSQCKSPRVSKKSPAARYSYIIYYLRMWILVQISIQVQYNFYDRYLILLLFIIRFSYHGRVCAIAHDGIMIFSVFWKMYSNFPLFKYVSREMQLSIAYLVIWLGARARVNCSP